MKNELLLSLFSPPKNQEIPVKNILAVSTTALGDSLWAAPAIEALYHSFPGAKIALLGSRVCCDVFRHHPFLSRLYLYNSPWNSFTSLRRRLQGENFDTALLFHTSQRLVLPLPSRVEQGDRFSDQPSAADC